MRKRFLSMVLALVIVLGMLPMTAMAVETSGTCGDNLKWVLENGVLTISGAGKMTDYEYTLSRHAPWYNYRDTINTVVIQGDVTSIGDDAFSDCSNLTSVTIPDTVTSIGEWAFYRCTSLDNVKIPSNVTSIGLNAFARCSKLSNISIPDGIASLELGTFKGCTSLTDIELPDSVTSIGSDVFSECSNLTNVTIPNSVTSIGERAFVGCNSLTSFTIPNSVTSIGEYAFIQCGSLTSIRVDSNNPSYSSVDGVLFNHSMSTLIIYPATKQGDYIIPDSVIDIEDYAFYGCSGLTSVTIPNGVTIINDYTFSGCTNLQSAALSERITSIGTEAFRDCASLTDVNLPRNLSSIEMGAFAGCSGLTGVTIPDNVTSIGDATFHTCSRLTSVIISNRVTSIGQRAFYYCNSLTDVYYSGSEAEWNSISINNENEPLISAKIHYNSTGPVDITHTVTYDLNDGEGVVPTEFYLCGEAVAVTAQEPTKSGYTFKGWSDGTTTYQPGDTFTMPEHDVTLTAVWEASDPLPNGITAFYPANGATFDFADSTADTRMRIFFDREVSDAGGGRPELDFSAGTLEIHKASDDSVVYQVQYNTEVSQWNVDGSPTAVVLQNASSALDYDTEYYVTMPAGFIKMADGSESPAIGKNDWRFTTKETPQAISYNLTYDPNDGTFGPFQPTGHKAGETITVRLTVPTRDGYVFKGWSDSTSADLYQPGDTFTMPDQDVILVATWEPIPGNYAVTYQLNGGIGDVPSECWPAGETVTIIAKVPTKDGYNFDGWSDGNTTYQPGDTFTMPEYDVTLTAAWAATPTISPEMRYVQEITQYSLANADEESKKSIQNAIYNLLFKAQFRPTAGPAIAGIPATFTGTTAEIMQWYPQNSHALQSQVTDSVLGTVWLRESAAGCMAYALFATNYVYGTNGSGVSYNGPWTEGDIRKFIGDHANPGARMSYAHSNPIEYHAIVFLGKDASDNGFYFASYEGGASSKGVFHQLTVKYSTYSDFIKTAKTLAIRDTNSGVYSQGTAKPVTRIILRVECPVEARVTLGDSILDSRDTVNSASFGSVSRVGEAIIFDLEYNENYELEIIGTGDGAMDIGIEYQNDDKNIVNTRYFKNIPIEDGIKITSNAFDVWGSFILYQNLGTDDEKIWGAGINQIVSETDESYSSKYNGPDLENHSSNDPARPTIPSIPSTPSTPWYPSSSWSPNTTTATSTNTITAPSVTGGTVSLSPSSAKTGQSVTITTTPDPGYELASLTATSADGKNVELTNAGNGKYTFTMPNSKVTVDAVFSKTWNNPFSDVAEGAWYYDAVKFVSQNGMMNGVGNSLFAPEIHLSRAMLAEILYNKEGRPAMSGGTSAFPDVSLDAWYADAVSWAFGQGIVNGYSNGLFGPNDDITREQLAAMLYRYAGNPTPPNLQLNFTDAYKVSDWAQDAVRWAVGQGVLNGKGNGILDPTGKATRAEAAQMIMNYFSKK